METHEHAVKVLNGLIETTLDSVHGYKDAAAGAKEPQLKTLFEARAAKRRELVNELQQEVRTFGGQPGDHQSMAGALHNRFLDLKAAITGGDKKAIVDEVERGVDVIKGKFEKALKDDDLPPPARELINRAYTAIKADHDEVSRMKHQLH